MNTGITQFLCKLNPPRPTFVKDMTEAERNVMQQHAIYWKGLTDRGIAIVFGLVLDPKGPWGVGIVEIADEPNARAIGTNDPAVKVGLTFEIYPMPDAIQAVKSTRPIVKVLFSFQIQSNKNGTSPFYKLLLYCHTCYIPFHSPPLNPKI